jgi:hypothetical protein
VGDVEAYLERLAERVRADDLEVQTAAVSSAHGAAAAVLEYLHAQPPRLVVLSTHARADLERVVAGSTAAEIMRASNAPVLLTRRASSVDEEFTGDLPHVKGMRFLTPTRSRLIARHSTGDLLAERERLRQLIGWLEEEFVDTETRSIGDLAASDQHPADVGTETYEREKDLALLTDFRYQLGLVDDELAGRGHRDTEG